LTAWNLTALMTISNTPTDLDITQDTDAAETQEWLEALDCVLRSGGPRRCQELLCKIHEHARSRGIEVSSLLNTPYCNTIPLSSQPAYPGDIDLERKITSIVRWNALAMVVRANRHGSEMGGHLASYASAADLFEVGFNHFFRGSGTNSTSTNAGDLVFFQPHCSPGIYARAFLEDRLTREHLDSFRREVEGKGLSSYPHPWLMPDFWQFPTGSMGLGPIAAVYQARFMHYLNNRGLLSSAGRRVWAFVGDGEMDEPESTAGLSFAAREGLDNLIFVVNCNLQRLDGPVRGNGSIVQELERVFTGAGWNVIKLLWGSDWDDLFARDRNGDILRRFRETVDGELQSYAAHDASYNRERFFNKYDDLARLVSHLSDPQIDRLSRGGHDPVKIHAAFDAAVRHEGSRRSFLHKQRKGMGSAAGQRDECPPTNRKNLTPKRCYRFETGLD
jgi:pyruvate dehydrogenase E1 component